MRGAKHRLELWSQIAAAGVMLVVVCLVTALNLRPSLADWPVIEARDAAITEGLSLRYIGTAGVVLSDGQDTLVIDGFVTRPSLRDILSGPLLVDTDRVRQVREQTGVERLSAIMTTHSHYDHAMDAPEWVRQAGGEVWGTASTRRIALADGVDSVRVIQPGEVRQAGAFEVRVFRLDHAPGEMMGGEVAEDFSIPARVGEYRTGGGLGFYFVHGQCRILAVPSAGQVHADLGQYPADVILLSVGQLGLQDKDYIRRYWHETVEASGAKRVILVHWDDFSRPLDRPLKPMPYAVERVDVAMRQLTQLAAPDVVMGFPVLFEPLDLGAQGPCQGVVQ